MSTKVEPNNQSVQINQASSSKWNSQSLMWLAFVGVIAIATKFYGISKPAETSYDEVGVGKFISSYIKREFFLDINPPLGKLILSAVSYLFGDDGSFSYGKIGASFAASTVPYIQLRTFSALCGVFTVVAIYSTLIEMKFSVSIAVLAACMATFDNALAVHSRLILLDSQLILFIIMACFSWVKFRSKTDTPFTIKWWFWLSATGVFLGFALGVKTIGFFVTAIIGLCTIYDLWDVSGSIKTPKNITVLYHWLARILCLIVIPITIFIIPYIVHLMVVTKSGSGDEFMTNEFQTTLAGNKVSQHAEPVYYGSTIKLMNKKEKIYLHSHKHKYPERYEGGKVGSQGQQVTGYHHPDDNNDWIILPDSPDASFNSTETPRNLVKNKDIVRLKHVATGNYLMTHNVASPLTTTNQEVSAIDAHNSSHAKYDTTLWKIKFRETEYLFSNAVEFELMHKETKTYLTNQKENLPEWAYKMREINTGKGKSSSKNWWFISKLTTPNHTASNETEPTFEFDSKLTFWSKFSEFMQVSFDSKTKIPDRVPYLASPNRWPLLTQGINIWKSADKRENVFLLCNPLSWYLCVLSIPALLGLIAVDLVVYLRGGNLLTSQERSYLYPKGVFFLGCYLSHSLLFVLLGKTLFLHEYMPCYLFSMLVFATLYQVAATRFKILNNPAVVGVLCSIIVGVFFRLSALTYATNLSEDSLNSLKWSKSWRF